MAKKISVNNAESELPQEFYDLVGRTYKEKPDPEDVYKLEIWLERSPNIWRSVFDLTYVVRRSLIIRLIQNEIVQTAIENNVAEMKRAMDYDSVSTLEQLLIDNVIITWLRLQLLEFQHACNMDKSDIHIIKADYWDKRLSSSQRHHLQACETLARVRRLMSNKPMLQVNIATQSGQQMNIAGDLVKK